MAANQNQRMRMVETLRANRTVRLRFRYGATTFARAKAGGADRDRTGDLMLAKHALSQLSYSPTSKDGGPG